MLDGAAVISGASSGLGRELAIRLAKVGTPVALLARSAERLSELADQIRAGGGKAFPRPVDVTDREDVLLALSEAEGALGPIGLVVANAGIGHPVEEIYDPAAVEQVYRVNVIGAMNVILPVVPEMIRRGRGQVVGIASLASYQGLPGNADYCGSKAALRIHLEALRVELAPKGIAVTTVCPGFVRTPMTDKNDFDMPFLMEVGPAAERIHRAILRRSKVVDFPLPMKLAVHLGRLLPRGIFDKIVRRGPKPGTRTQTRSTGPTGGSPRSR